MIFSGSLGNYLSMPIIENRAFGSFEQMLVGRTIVVGNAQIFRIRFELLQEIQDMFKAVRARLGL